MLRLVLNRIPQMLVVVIGCSILTFAVVNVLPGDIVHSILGEDYTEEAANQLREQLHLNDPLIVRYFRWLGESVTGDLGVSLLPPHVPVADLIGRSLLPTLELVILGQLFGLILGVLLAVISVASRNAIVDRVISGLALICSSVPGFVLGILLLGLLATQLHLVSPLGWVDPDTGGWGENLIHITFPSLVLGLFAFPLFLRVFRAELVEQLDREDYVTLAKLKGIPTRRVVFAHAVRNSSFGLMTILGVNTARLVGGVVVIEQIFSIPGMGSLITTSVVRHDAPSVMASVCIVAIFVVIANLLVDIAYALLDPRVRDAT
ncbi:MAG: ABC transporter permease [Microbacteriaceae bacterium]|nr:ABC transporter permease [Microbacteriaceae bacterium]